jgi:alanyl-tRNA synthetase
MTGDEIREDFLRFFESKEHLRIPSSSLIPAADPTLLLTNAGMVQFKPYFTGEMTPPGPRMTSVQKCFRTTDIDEVGDATHLTFFEMLGNFSVGDYFKKEAVEYAWEFLTEHLGLEKGRLWASVFVDDDEAFGYWTATGIPAERIRRFGEADNFWGPAGNEGPCGPCSEIHYDFGSELGCRQPDCGPNCENIIAATGRKCDRFVELWNLVFMQFYQAPDGSRTPLPAPNIDTGMGLERAAVILQGKRSIYETDIFEPIVKKVAELCGKQYGKDPDTDYAIRVVAEHARSAAFLIGDGVVPGNDGRDYVLRRVIRRAIRYGKKLGLEATDVGTAHPVGAIHESPLPVEGRVMLPQVVEVVIDRMKAQYPDLEERREFILRVMALEEERFGEVLSTGLELLEEEIRFRIQEEAPFVERIRKDILSIHAGGAVVMAISYIGQLAQQVVMGGAKGVIAVARLNARLSTNPAWEYVIATLNEFPRLEQYPRDETNTLLAPLERNTKVISGWETFELYDTYGFPPELTQEIAREHGLEVDMEGFEREMEAQRSQSRGASEKFGGDFDAVRVYQDLGVGLTTFLGYEALTTSTVVVGLLAEGKPVDQAVEGENIEVVLKETPFYAEMGGQMGDAGQIIAGGGQGSTPDKPRAFSLHVEDTQSPIAGLTVHLCTVISGVINKGDAVEATVDSTRRQDTARNHTATHMLHAALRQVLGSHVRQHGSLVTPGRLRFDFTHVSPLTVDELREVQRLTNEKIRENMAVTSRETTYRDAVAQGALAFFGDRYGDQVRVVEVANVEHAEEVGSAPFSLEVCGGTHVHRTGDIGYCHIVSESSIGSGLRRIEAVSGRAAEELMASQSATLEEISRRLQVSSDQLTPRVEGMLAEMEQAARLSETLERGLLKRLVAELPRKQVAGVNVVTGELKVSDTDLLREAGDWLKNDIKSGVVVLGTVLENRPSMMIMATKDMVEQGFHAGNAVKEAAKAMGGGGGGRPEMAQAGGREPGKLKDALSAAEEEVRRWRQSVPK